MRVPSIDKRDAKAVEEQIKVLAKQYVPEWNYDENDPDFGVVFSKIFSEMFEDTINSYNRTSYNHYLTFLNLLGAKLLPSISSSGMVSVDVVPGTDGVFIQKGTSLYAAADNEEGRVYFQTVDSMFALDSKIQSIFVTNAKEDSISNIYDINQTEEISPFEIFADNECPNLQAHEIYFEDSEIFRLKDKIDVTIKFKDRKSLKNSEEISSVITQKDSVKWQIFNNGEWIDIEEVTKLDDGVRLVSSKGIEDCEVMGVESRFIRCTFNKIPKSPLRFTDVSYSCQGSKLDPDTLIFDTTELSKKDFFPFGEQYTVYSDFYIASSEAFIKKGAKVSINIDVQFVKVDLEKVPYVDTTKYKYVMSDLDFKDPEEVNIEIERVVWEYWNGRGWAKIYNDNSNEDFFVLEGENVETEKVLEFDCPDDMESIVLGPTDSCFIRARIVKVKNPLAIQGAYITPYIHNIDIDYKYIDTQVKCDTVYVRSNMSERVVDLTDDEVKPILMESICEHPTMYFCLDNPINNGPIKVLFDVEPGVYLDIPSIRWQYYSKSKYGVYSWNNMDILDKTENLSNSAIVTIIGRDDAVKSDMFGKEGYFIRVVNHDDKYYDRTSKNPIINGIYMNTIDVKQIEKRTPEYFSVDIVELNKSCKLSCANITDADVWVNEYGTLSAKEEEEIVNSKEKCYKVKYDDKGSVTEIWVNWHPLESIVCADTGERAFEIDYNKGVILFGDGRHGKIPPCGDSETIMVEYSISAGSIGNIGKNEVQGFSDSVPYISSVKNLKPMVGGVDMETVDYAAKRMSSKISGMNRIVTLDDFEDTIRCNDRNIYKIKCVPHVDNMSNPSIGTMSVAILPKDYMQGYEKFLVLKNRVENFVKDMGPLTLSGSTKMNVFEVMYVEISIKVDLVIDDYNCYQNLYQKIYNKLKAFLDPISGNFDKEGWPIGDLPRKESIYNYIKATENIRWIKSVNIFAKSITIDGKKDIDLEEIRKDYFTVPVFGEPEINIHVD